LPFKEQLFTLLGQLIAALPEKKPSACKQGGDMVLLQKTTQQALEAADNFDYDACIELIGILTQSDFGATINNSLEQVNVLLSDFDIGGAAAKLSQICESAKIPVGRGS
jgi:hypothetical protein